MLVNLQAHWRRIAVLAAVTAVALVIEIVQGESVVKMLLSAWLPALILVVLWSRAGWPGWLARSDPAARR
jgi:phage terminase large subunit-like protein